ncbi:MAG: 16S rRNA (adenine(1518)-N(6)/adenine(1519)-N(6))-dimethyltransferase RsmA [Candidatus Margulisiibacteriota bacterium]
MKSISQLTKDLLTKHNFHLKKSLGQNLLTDEACLNRIVEAADLSKDDTVIEIGTGTGILTMELAKAAKKVFTFEIDKRIVEIAREYLKDCSNIEIINADFLESDISHSSLVISHLKFVANVPYYITTPIIEKIVGTPHAAALRVIPQTIILTVQREFAQRMVAKPGTEQYGSFSIFINYYTEAEIVSYIPKSAFLPQPTVGSALIRLVPRPVAAHRDAQLQLFQIVRAAFNQRRKTLRNALIAKFDADKIDNALSKAGIDPKIRGERLSIEDFVRLSGAL